MLPTIYTLTQRNFKKIIKKKYPREGDRSAGEIEFALEESLVLLGTNGNVGSGRRSRAIGEDEILVVERSGLHYPGRILFGQLLDV